ncbi:MULTISPECIES: hypothetical protein [Streptomyces]|uniref:DUF3800 domain-containing protein n=1 Tax=Streptomyces siderophoricus TaxID=2802281 RepID=A0ABS1MW74_9ACTN|nr:hypothetical protein [Streptomyces sp. 9-7]MBL1091993.1 hypothetical protein [Streptomyces sp. 9-7]
MATKESAAPLRIIYGDDAGDARTITAFASLSVHLDDLAAAKQELLRFRASLEEDPALRLPIHASLHAQDLAAGRGRHLYRAGLTGADREAHLAACRGVIRRGLETVAAVPGARVTAVYRETDDYGRDRPALQRAWLTRVNADLAAADEYGVVIVDGDGTDTCLVDAYHALPERDRRIVGVPLFESARINYFLQAADLLAYAAYQSVAKRPEREFLWDWFGATLPWADGPTAR